MWWVTTTTTKSLQSCPTLCDPIDGSPPGSPVPGILQARTLEWVAISFSSWVISSVLLFSLQVMSDSSQPHELQHTRLPCPSPSLGVCWNSYLWSQCCYPTISSSVTPFSSYPQSFPASGSFPMSRLIVSGSQITGASALVLPMDIQSLFHLGLIGLISCCPRDSKESSLASQFKNISSLALSLYGSTLTFIHDYWKNHSFDCTDLCQLSDVSAF